MVSFSDLVHTIAMQAAEEEVATFALCIWMLRHWHEGSCSSKNLISLQTLNFVDEDCDLHGI